MKTTLIYQIIAKFYKEYCNPYTSEERKRVIKSNINDLKGVLKWK